MIWGQDVEIFQNFDVGLAKRQLLLQKELRTCAQQTADDCEQKPNVDEGTGENHTVLYMRHFGFACLLFTATPKNGLSQLDVCNRDKILTKSTVGEEKVYFDLQIIVPH